MLIATVFLGYRFARGTSMIIMYLNFLFETCIKVVIVKYKYKIICGRDSLRFYSYLQYLSILNGSGLFTNS